MKFIHKQRHFVSELFQWSAHRLFFVGIVFHMLLLVIMIVSYVWIPLPREFKGMYSNDFLFGYYQWDASSYRNICVNGYVQPYLPYPESIQYAAFLPGTAVMSCVARIARSVINLVDWGPIVVVTLFFGIFCVALKYMIDSYNMSQRQKWYVWWFIILFPTAMFLHFPFTEVYFLTGLAIAIGAARRGNWTLVILAGIFMSFFRITAIPVGVVFAIWYLVDSMRRGSVWYKSLRFLPLFTLFGLGTLLTFSYFQLRYGRFWLFFESQKDYFGRGDHTLGLKELRDIINENYITYWDSIDWTSMIQQTGFWFYTKEFRDVLYTILPVVFFLVGIVALLLKRRLNELLISLALVVPGALTGLNSINRYVFHALPVMLLYASASYKLSWFKYIALIVSFAIFIIFVLLHTRQFWVA